MDKMFAMLAVFRQGNAVADPALWKNRAGLTMALAALIMALAAAGKAFGYDLGMDKDGAMAVAGGIATVVGLWANYATSDKVGTKDPGLAVKYDTGAALAGPTGNPPAAAPAASTTWVQPAPAAPNPQADMDLRGGP